MRKKEKLIITSQTKVGDLEKEWNTDFGVRSDMKVETLLKRKGFPSLVKWMKATEKIVEN